MKFLFLAVSFFYWNGLGLAQIIDSVDNIVLKIPKEWQINKQPTFRELLYIDKNKKTFCQLAVYNATTATTDKKADFQNEWKELVEKNFSVSSLSEQVLLKTKSGNSIQRLGAKAIAKNGNQYYVQLNVYDCGPTIQSVMAVSNNQQAMQLYDSLWQSLITTVKKDKISTPLPTTTNPPANKVFITKWGKSDNPIGAYSKDIGVNLAFSGYKRCEYDFKPDGTYTFQGENWGGKANANKFKLNDEKEYGLIDETGTFQVSGDQLIITPTKNVYRVVQADGKIKRTETLGLSKRTYTWQTYYAIGMEETRLILTASKPNIIDGDFSSFEPAVSYPNSFCYILGKKMFFTYLPLKL